MSVITPKQETILANLKTQLEGIDGTGSYNNDVKTVTRRLMDPDRLGKNNMPALLIMPLESSFTAMTGEEMTAGSTIESIADGFAIEILGYVTSDTDTNDEGLLQKEMIKLFADIVLAVYTDITLSGSATAITLISHSNYFDYYEENIGIIVIRFAIKYDFSPAINP